MITRVPGTPRRFNVEQRRALELLPDIPCGVTGDLLVLAHGVDGDMIAGSLVAYDDSRSRRLSGPPPRFVRSAHTRGRPWCGE